MGTIDGCDFAGISLVEGATVTTPHYTDPIVIEVDALQHRYQQGPCLDVIADGVTVTAEDLIDDTRWPQFGPPATSAGIRSAMALSLSAVGTHGALNLYARQTHAFGVVDQAKGLLLSGLAGEALSKAQAHDEDTQQLDNLHNALAFRAVIGQAQGILIERERISAGESFDILRRASQHLDMKLRDVAQALVDTEKTPTPGHRPDTDRPT